MAVIFRGGTTGISYLSALNGVAEAPLPNFQDTLLGTVPFVGDWIPGVVQQVRRVQRQDSDWSCDISGRLMFPELGLTQDRIDTTLVKWTGLHAHVLNAVCRRAMYWDVCFTGVRSTVSQFYVPCTDAALLRPVFMAVKVMVLFSVTLGFLD
ncbi:hypothetical protein FB451DRAFT_1171904 [Mycena latifolia]|nr:hypothetical protein FB451DRAFT_1171904 [Mycena latifolia]